MRVVIPSLHYGDYLATTLPAWRAFLPHARITVVTAHADDVTKRVALSVKDVVVLSTSVWTRSGAVFNKAAALDAAFGFGGWPEAAPAIGEACLALDADVYPCGTPPPSELRADTLYGCPRYECRTPAELEAHLDGRTPRQALELILPRRKGDPPETRTMTPGQVARACLGYFQLFRYAPGISFGHSKTAGGYDTVFRSRFAERRALQACYVLHLGARDRRNWLGRVLPEWPYAVGVDA